MAGAAVEAGPGFGVLEGAEGWAGVAATCGVCVNPVLLP